MPVDPEKQATLRERYLKSRRGKTKKYVMDILSYLSKQSRTDMDDPEKQIVIGTVEKVEIFKGEKLISSAPAILKSPKKIGWVRTKDLLEKIQKDNPDIAESTFYRLLTGLENEHLIERRGLPKGRRWGQLPVYYRVPMSSSRWWSLSKKRLVEELQFAIKNANVLRLEVAAAETLLSECHRGELGYSPKDAIIERAKKFPLYENVKKEIEKKLVGGKIQK